MVGNRDARVGRRCERAGAAQLVGADIDQPGIGHDRIDQRGQHRLPVRHQHQVAFIVFLVGRLSVRQELLLDPVDFAGVERRQRRVMVAIGRQLRLIVGEFVEQRAVDDRQPDDRDDTRGRACTYRDRIVHVAAVIQDQGLVAQNPGFDDAVIAHGGQGGGFRIAGVHLGTAAAQRLQDGVTQRTGPAHDLGVGDRLSDRQRLRVQIRLLRGP